MKEWSDSSGGSIGSMSTSWSLRFASDKQIEHVTLAMGRWIDMLLQIVSGQNITQLEGIVVGRVVDVDVKIADDDQRSRVGRQSFHEVGKVGEKWLRHRSRTRSVEDDDDVETCPMYSHLRICVIGPKPLQWIIVLTSFCHLYVVVRTNLFADFWSFRNFRLQFRKNFGANWRWKLYWQIGYDCLTVFYSNNVPTTHRFWDIRLQKWRDFENRVKGPSRSLKMSPFDRAHITSYKHSLATMGLSRTVSEIDGDFSRKSQIFPYRYYWESNN